MMEVQLGQVHRSQSWPPVGVGNQDVRCLGEVSPGCAQNGVACLRKVLKRVTEHKPANSTSMRSRAIARRSAECYTRRADHDLE